MQTFLIIFFSAILTDNFVLSKFLGICPFLGVSKKLNTAVSMSLAVTRKVCSAGCIGCGKCAKACEAGAIKLENNLAHIDAELCTNCGKCESECPVKVITSA